MINAVTDQMNPELKYHLRNDTNQIYLGRIGNRSVAYIDWDHPVAIDWLINATSVLNVINADGIFIQNNVFRDDTPRASRQSTGDSHVDLSEVRIRRHATFQSFSKYFFFLRNSIRPWKNWYH